MIAEMAKVWRARTWMKKNVPFLYSWHAYVGYELELFESFKKPASIQEVALSRNIEMDLLEQWVEVGITLKHLKRASKDRIRVKNGWKLPSSKTEAFSSGVLLKEMMELHIPALLSYPSLLRNHTKQSFNSELHGSTVAKTSILLERFAFPKLQKVMKKYKVDSVLDLGCGEGGYLRRLADRYPKKRMVGIEIHEAVAKEAQEALKPYDNIEIKNRDLHGYDPEFTFHLIMANNLFHYIDPSERLAFFKKASQWLGDKGVFFVLTPMQKSKHGKQFSSAFNSFFMTFENLYPIPSQKEMETLAKKTGFKVVSIDPIVKEGGWYALCFKKK
ncbi:methyltransferase domain-containing protein [Rossellomorea aquimaris]|uniref:class I SAM-dependent methyltransferase n=1 Tax=Rossellomorea aquimaris TaxID=189382 RepID=UPI001CD74308|nr:class I SAM-dependent methyltransferase [Rossellomorea aquimaris]MCA1055940.1 methyltransferase domain-containing protein [Rossellomorea aquimaris]